MTVSANRNAALFAAAILALAACDRRPAAPAENAAPDIAAAPTPAAPVADYAAIAEAAVADPARPDADRADDARRKAAETLAFFEIAPGMTVIDMEAGGGWYTELIARAVGPDGKVYMQNPHGYRDWVGAEVDKRLEGGRLPTVTLLESAFDALDVADASVDRVAWIQGPHDLFFIPSEGESLGDPRGAFVEIARVLKPGGALAVIDHAAAPGSPPSTGNETHRIDKAVIVDLAAKAGLRLEAESAALANPADDYAKSVFDKSVRGKTDQFILRFRKG